MGVSVGHIYKVTVLTVGHILYVCYSHLLLTMGKLEALGTRFYLISIAAVNMSAWYYVALVYSLEVFFGDLIDVLTII